MEHKKHICFLEGLKGKWAPGKKGGEGTKGEREQALPGKEIKTCGIF